MLQCGVVGMATHAEEVDDFFAQAMAHLELYNAGEPPDQVSTRKYGHPPFDGEYPLFEGREGEGTVDRTRDSHAAAAALCVWK